MQLVDEVSFQSYSGKIEEIKSFQKIIRYLPYCKSSNFLLQDLNADVMLNGLILGESLLNDAVAIVLCGSIEEYSKLSLTSGDSVEPSVLLFTILRFFTILIGSVGLGALIGSITGDFFFEKGTASFTDEVFSKDNEKESSSLHKKI